jgi:hypothetical protein
MKFYGIKDIEGFFNIINECKGTVELITSDGDRLNLKSRLCQYISFAKIVAGDNSIPEMESIASDGEDRAKLLLFMMEG